MLRKLLPRPRRLGVPLLALAALGFAANPVSASDSTLIASGYWAGFWDFWGGQFKKQDRIVLFALGVGGVSLFIITRGQWKK